MPFIVFSSDLKNLAVADRFCCIVRAIKVETFPSITKNTGCYCNSTYKTQMSFFGDPANYKKNLDLILIFFFSRR